MGKFKSKSHKEKQPPQSPPMDIGGEYYPSIIIFLLFLANAVYAQDMNVTFKEIKDSSAAKNYEIDVRYPQVDFGPEALMGMRGVARDINTALDTIITREITDFKTTMAETNMRLEGATNELDIKCTVSNQSNSLLSVLFENFTYIVGTAHPSTIYSSFNYSVTAYGILGISNLFKKETGYLKYISDYSIKSLKKQQTKMGIEIDNEWIEKGAGPDEKNFSCFNISADSLVITFNAYQVAAYYVGSETVGIPLGSMKDMIDPQGPLGYLFK